jgi:hypothetical protein
MVQFKVFIERIEGPWAILETLDGDSFSFPLALLPASLEEGSCLKFKISDDPVSQRKMQKRIQSVRHSLKNK